MNDSQVNDLVLKSGIHVEACPFSARGHGLLNAIGQYKPLGINFGLNTDDPSDLFKNCTLRDVENLLTDVFSWTEQDFKLFYQDARKAGFVQFR